MAERTWDNGDGTNNWGDANNWSDNTKPGDGDSALFDATSNDACTVDEGVDLGVGSINVAADYTGTITQSNTVDCTDLTISDASTWNCGATLTVDNDFTITAGTFDAAGQDVNIDRDFISNGATTRTVSAGEGTWTIGRNWDTTGSNITINYDTSTVIFSGTSTIDGINYDRVFYNLNVGQSGTTTTLGFHVQMYGVLTVGSGEIDGAFVIYTRKAGEILSLHEDATLSFALIYLSPWVDTTFNIPAHTYNTGFRLLGAGEGSPSSCTCEQTGNVTCEGLWIDNQSYTDRTSKWDTKGYDLNVVGVGYARDIRLTADISNFEEPYSGVHLIMNNSTITCSEDVYLLGTVEAGGSTLIMDGANKILRCEATLNNFTKEVSSADTLNIKENRPIGISGNLTLTGVAGDLLSLRSEANGTPFFLEVVDGATYTMEYLDIEDCAASGVGARMLDVDKSVNSGGNSNVTFDAKSMMHS